MAGLVDFNLNDVGGLFTSLREALTGKKIEDPTVLAQIQLQLDTLENGLKQGQIEINKVEAASPNWFIAGWRPFIGWICGFGLGYNFLAAPMLGWMSINYGWRAPPSVDVLSLLNLVLAMLGLGTMRSVEKINKAQDKH